jgi:hypothetical protein
MKNPILKITLFVTINLLLSVSCQNSEQQALKQDESVLKQAGIESVQPVTSSNVLYREFLNSEFYNEYSKANQFGKIDENGISITQFVDKPVILIGMKLKTSGNSLGAFYNTVSGKIDFAWIQQYSKISSNSESINQYYIDGNKFSKIDADLSTRRITKVENFSDFKSKFQSARLGGGSYDKCMNIAASACSGDAACSIMCGLIFLECVAATMIACI